MVNLDDLSKLLRPIRPGSLDYIYPFIPGLFFEASILLGSPQLVASHISTTQNLVHLSPYIQLAIALLLAFIIGNASMLFVNLIQHGLTYVHSLRLVLVQELSRWPLIPLLNRLANSRFLASRPRFHNFRIRVQNRALLPDEHARHAAVAWHTLARKLLKDRYGVNLEDVKDEWESIFWSIGNLTSEEWRGHLLLIASEATAWCGIIAASLAPALRNRYYIGLCATLLLTGLHNDYYAAGRRTDPAAVAAWKTRALLREYEKDRRATLDSEEKAQPPETPLT